MVSYEIISALEYHPNIDSDLAVCAALLHDVIEDTRVTYEEIKLQFGADLADGILALSKDEKVHPDQRLEDSLRRIMLQPQEIRMVKLADRITNMNRPPDGWGSSKRKNYSDEAETILETLGTASGYLSERLKGKIDYYRANYLSQSQEKTGNEFIRIKGFAGKIYSPPELKNTPKKHPCPDCRSCRFCSEEKCSLCLKKNQ